MSNAQPSFPAPQPAQDQSFILGFDPGRQKCGVAVMGIDRKIVLHTVVLSESVIEELNNLCQIYPITLLVMGDQTTSKDWKQKLQKQLVPPLSIIQVNERFSSLEARDRYWQMYPPQGLAQLIPTSLRKIHRPIDDIVAIILIERYLEQLVTP